MKTVQHSNFTMPIDVYVVSKLTRIYSTSESREVRLPANTQEFSVDKLNFYMIIQEYDFEDFSAE